MEVGPDWHDTLHAAGRKKSGRRWQGLPDNLAGGRLCFLLATGYPKEMRRQSRLLYLFGFVGSLASASPLPVHLSSRPAQPQAPLRGGAWIGGQAGDEFSLLGITHMKIKSNEAGDSGERMVLFYGDRRGHPLNGKPGYFHISLDTDARRVVIDLAQVQSTAVDPVQLRKILVSSNLVAGSEMTMDPIDGSTNITLKTRRPVTVRASTQKNEPGKVVIEIKPLVTPSSDPSSGPRK